MRNLLIAMFVCFVSLNSLFVFLEATQKSKMIDIESRVVPGSGRVGFGPNPDPTRRRRVEGGKTQNRLPASLGLVGFGFGWCSGRFSRG